MDKSELIQKKNSLTQEYEALISKAKEEERKLTDEEEKQVESLRGEVEDLDVQLEDLEKAERQELYDFCKTEIETAIRAMTLNDAEAELNKAYVELDRAYSNYYDALEAKVIEERKEEIRGLIKEVLHESTNRSEKEKQDALEAERLLKEQESEKELEILRGKIEEAEKELETERSNKEDLEIQLEENKRKLAELENKREMEKTIFDVIREASLEGGQSNVIEVSRAAADGDTTAMANGIPVQVEKIDRIGKKAMWERMGLDIQRGAKGSYILPYEDPRVAEGLAELSAVTKDSVSPLGISVNPYRYSHSKDFTYETLNSATDAFIQSILDDCREAINRRITSDVYAKALAGAAEVASASTITRDNLIDVMAAVDADGEGAFLAARSTYLKTLKVAIDAGSGKFLSTNISANGEVMTFVTELGVPFWYNSLFTNVANEEYIIYGVLNKIYVADYASEKVIIDPFTKASTGQVVVTVIRMASVVLKNPTAFARTADLDPTV